MAREGKWDDEVIHGALDDGTYVTLKLTKDGDEVLMARSHLDDIQRHNDHVHAWNQRNGTPDHHDTRWTPSLSPNGKPESRSSKEAHDSAYGFRRKQLIDSAEACGSDIAAVREIQREWDSLGKPSPTEWAAFKKAVDSVYAAGKAQREQRKREHEARMADWARNRSAKEALVREAESVASSSDLKSAGDRMKTLSDRWKAIGPCDRADNDRLWSQFNAARTKLHERKQREFDERKRQWAQNKSAKEALVSRMGSLLHTGDFRAAKDEARALQEKWKQVGPCEKSDNDRLWNEFNAAKTRLFEAARQDGERRKSEARQRAQQRVWQLEEQLRSAEAAIIRANDSYSRALSLDPPR